MNKQKTKIPVMAISIVDPMVQSDENNMLKNPLFDIEEFPEPTLVAHLTLHSINHYLYPAAAELFWLEYLGEKDVNGEEGISFQFKPADVLESGSFEVEYGYDSEIDNEIPKYIVIN